MCCFSGEVERVTDTRIFARPAPGDRQVLIYEMTLAARRPVAMVLPIPTPAGSPEDAVRFVSLEAYPDLFDDLAKAFPRPMSRSVWRNSSSADVVDCLTVHKVGAFIASFVPSLDDFARIDPQFRMSPAPFRRMRDYAGWGYAVFQLAMAPGELTRIHPMAFEFPTRHPDKLFFPTLHIHDGAVHPYATFAHALYAQGHEPDRWRKVHSLTGIVDERRAAALVHADAPAWHKEIHGEKPNADTWA